MNGLKRAIKELYFWRKSDTGCFHNKLFDLIAKADKSNKERLAAGFPMEVAAYKKWQEAKSEDEFFKNFLPEFKEANLI